VSPIEAVSITYESTCAFTQPGACDRPATPPRSSTHPPLARLTQCNLLETRESNWQCYTQID